MAKKKPPTLRFCTQCAADISHRGGRSTMCRPCAEQHHRAVARARQRAKMADPDYRRHAYDRDNAARRYKYATDPAYRAKVRDRALALRSTPKARAICNAAERAKYAADPSLRERKAARLKERRNDPAERARMNALSAKNARNRWANDPVYRAREIARHRDYVRKRWTEDPEWRAAENARVRGWDKTVTRAAIIALLDAQDGLCPLCEISLRHGYHRDHIIPYAKGGPSTLANLQLLCPPCNIAKSDKLE